MNETAYVTASDARRTKAARIGWTFGAVIAVIVLAALAASLLPAAILNTSLARQIHRTTGLSTTIEGRARFALFPQPHLDIEKIGFANPQAKLHVKAQRFVGYLRLLPLLIGRIEVGRAVLYEPKIVIDLDDRPMTSDSELGRAAAAKSASPEAAVIDRAKLGIIDIVDGSARLHHSGGAQDIFIDKINVTADWRSLDASAILTGQFDFHDVPMQVKAWLAQPVELLRGGDSATTLQLESDVLGAQASGRIAITHLQYTGGLYITAPSLRRALELAGFKFAKHGRFGAFDLRCDADINASTTALTNLRLDLDDNEYEGTLAVQPDGNSPLVSGTLATNLLDLTPFLEGLPQPLAANGRWNDAPLDLADLGFTNLDLRLSASHLRLNDIEVHDAAFSILTRPGFVDLTLAEATADGGAIRGRLSLTGKGTAIDLRVSGSATDINLQSLVHANGAVRHPLAGALSGSVILESTGIGFDQLMHGLSGHAQINVVNGQIIGVDLAALLKNGQASINLQGDPTQTMTNFDKAAFAVEIAQGAANVVNGQIGADGLAGFFGGNANIGARSLAFWAFAEPLSEPGKMATTGNALRLQANGPWDHLNWSLDRPPVQSLPRNPNPPKSNPPRL
jgi:AsmA protein